VLISSFIGTPLLDHNGKTIPIAKMLATKPLRHELMTRPGPGNRKLTYLSGDSVTRTLNDIFGFDGWCLEVKETKREVRKREISKRMNAKKLLLSVWSIVYSLLFSICRQYNIIVM